MEQEMEITLRGYQIIEKIVKNSNTSGRVYVPNEWVGKRVKVILLEPEIGESESKVGGPENEK
jgi:putative transposon-encoded protein